MILSIGCAGILGALMRYQLGKWINSRSRYFPLGTWVINITGAFLLGVIVSLHGSGKIPNGVYLTIGTGFCGAYTTFSTFGYETIQLLEQKKIQKAILYVVLSTCLGLVAAWLGMLA